MSTTTIEPKFAERRKGVSEDRARGRLKWVLTILVIMLTVVGTAWLIRSPVLSIKSVTVTGATMSHPDVVVADLGMGQGTPTIDIDDLDEELRQITRWRKVHQPGGTFNAGSVFKNPTDAFAGQIIDELGLKGHRVGGAVVSEKHANFIINVDAARAADVEALINHVMDRVERDHGVGLVPEVRVVGDAA